MNISFLLLIFLFIISTHTDIPSTSHSPLLGENKSKIPHQHHQLVHNHPPETLFIPSNSRPEWMSLSDSMLIVLTIDGNLFGIHPSDGSIEWVLSLGKPLFSTSNPNLNSTFLPGLDSSLYHYHDTNGIIKMGLDIPSLISASPMNLGSNLVLLGSKTSNVFNLDPIRGILLENPTPDTISLVRTDYDLEISVIQGSSHWNTQYSRIYFNNFDAPDTTNDIYSDTLSSTLPIFQATLNGQLNIFTTNAENVYTSQQKKSNDEKFDSLTFGWQQTFDSPVLSLVLFSENSNPIHYNNIPNLHRDCPHPHSQFSAVHDGMKSDETPVSPVHNNDIEDQLAYVTQFGFVMNENSWGNFQLLHSPYSPIIKQLLRPFLDQIHTPLALGDDIHNNDHNFPPASSITFSPGYSQIKGSVIITNAPLIDNHAENPTFNQNEYLPTKPMLPTQLPVDLWDDWLEYHNQQNIRSFIGGVKPSLRNISDSIGNQILNIFFNFSILSLPLFVFSWFYYIALGRSVFSLGPKPVSKDGILKIEDLVVDLNKILGYGSNGTVVFLGYFHKRKVAVKRILSDFYPIASREINTLVHIDDIPHVVRYFSKLSDSQFIYLVLEYCDSSLFHLVQTQPEKFVNSQTREPTEYALKCIREIATGLSDLHQGYNIIHRDLKPQNILIASDGSIRISDLGIAKQLEMTFSTAQSRRPLPRGTNQKSTTNTLVGTMGWVAPEILKQISDGFSPSVDSSDSKIKFSKASDIFAFGCLIHYIITGGKHPFGSVFEREQNILKGKLSLDSAPQQPLWLQLLNSILNSDPLERIDCSSICHFPTFWTPQKKLDFLLVSSDILEFENSNSVIVGDFEQFSKNVFPPTGWGNEISPKILANLGRYRKYNYHAVRDLLRVMRNKHHHYHQLEPSLQSLLGAIPDKYLFYFCHRFPDLFFRTWTFLWVRFATHRRLGSFFSNIVKSPAFIENFVTESCKPSPDLSFGDARARSPHSPRSPRFNQSSSPNPNSKSPSINEIILPIRPLDSSEIPVSLSHSPEAEDQKPPKPTPSLDWGRIRSRKT